VLLTTRMAFWLFHERLKRRSMIGIALSAVALVLVNVA